MPTRRKQVKQFVKEAISIISVICKINQPKIERISWRTTSFYTVRYQQTPFVIFQLTLPAQITKYLYISKINVGLWLHGNFILFSTQVTLSDNMLQYQKISIVKKRSWSTLPLQSQQKYGKVAIQSTLPEKSQRLLVTPATNWRQVF